MKPTLIAYITSHGFGHATRCLEILRLIPETIDIEIVGTTPEWLVASSLQRPYTFHHLLHDPGIVQRTSLEQDIPATAALWSNLLSNYPAMAEAEAQRLRQREVRLVVGDISPFSQRVAALLGVPNLIVANFSWDWILAPHVAVVPLLEDIIIQIETIFHQCDLLLRTPLSGDLSVFPRRMDIPLVARCARRSCEDVRRELQIDPDKPLILISFGGHRQQNLASLCHHYPNCTFAVFGTEESSCANLRVLHPGRYHHPDVLAASDAVIGKLGYGLAGEVVVHHKPLLVVERSGFSETDIMEAELPRFIPLKVITQNEFFAGRWDTLYDLLADRQNHFEIMQTNGGEVGAEILQRTIADGLNALADKIWIERSVY